MDKKIIFILLIIFISLGSCNTDTIYLDPVEYTESDFFKDEDQMRQAVFGIYQKLGFFYAFRGGQNNNVAPVTLLPSDDLTTAAGYALENFTGLNGSNEQLSFYYQFAYQLIGRANTILQKIEENGDEIYKSQEQKNYNKGEALFLRAYMYFCLWNVYGTAPLITERIIYLKDAYPSNSKETELLDQAIIDLQEARNLLPESWPSEYKGRVVKNSAIGLRGKCLVFRGMINNAMSDFTDAISDFNALSGMSLMTKYGQNFDVKYENNEESLFEYQANESPGIANPYVWGGNDGFSVIGEIGAYYGMYTQSPNWIGNSYYTVTSSLMNAYHSSDPRKLYNIRQDTDPEPAEPLINVMKYIRNTASAEGDAFSHQISTNNPRILRYADILLLKAEAIVRSNGNLSEAISIINQIRERARNSSEGEIPSTEPADRNISESNSNIVLEWIFEERRLELAFEEGHRWWDLRRRHIVGEIDLKTIDFASLRNDCKFVETNVNFPLPSSQVVENPNMNQNAGY